MILEWYTVYDKIHKILISELIMSVIKIPSTIMIVEKRFTLLTLSLSTLLKRFYCVGYSLSPP